MPGAEPFPLPPTDDLTNTAVKGLSNQIAENVMQLMKSILQGPKPLPASKASKDEEELIERSRKPAALELEKNEDKYTSQMAEGVTEGLTDAIEKGVELTEEILAEIAAEVASEIMSEIITEAVMVMADAATGGLAEIARPMVKEAAKDMSKDAIKDGIKSKPNENAPSGPDNSNLLSKSISGISIKPEISPENTLSNIPTLKPKGPGIPGK